MDQDNKVQNLNMMLNSLQQQLVSEKLKLRKTQKLMVSKRQLVKSSHTLLEREFQGVFTDTPTKRRRWRPGRPFGLVPLLETSAPEEVAAVEHGQDDAQVTVSAWHSLGDDVIWVRARVRNTLTSTLYNVQLQTSSSLARRSAVTALQVDMEIDVCATYQVDPAHDVKQLDDLNLVYSFSDSGPNHCQRLRTGHVQDRGDLTWLTTVKDGTGVPPSLKVYYPHWITVGDEHEMDKLRQIGKMQRAPNSMETWISDDQSLVAVKSGNQNQVGCVDGMKLVRLVSRIQAKQAEE